MMECDAFASLMKPHHVRTIDNNVPWQQCFTRMIGRSTYPEIYDGYIQLKIQHLTNSIEYSPLSVFSYRFINLTDMRKIIVTEKMLLDEVKKKLYFIHSPNFDSGFTIREATFEIEEMADGSRKIFNIKQTQLSFGRFDFPDNYILTMVNWFLNPFDGSIFLVQSAFRGRRSGYTSIHTLSWIKLYDGINPDDDYSVPYAGELKVLDKCKFEFSRYNGPDGSECGILFSEGCRKLLIRFRMPNNPEAFDYVESPIFDTLGCNALLREQMTSIDSPITHEMTKSPTYALFGLDYDSHTIQLIAKFVPTSHKTHSDLLISTQLLSIYADGIGFSNSKAQSYLSQRSLMIGQYFKYTFFSTINKGVIAVTAVKSFVRAIQSGHLSLTPNKVWFPLEDDKIKMAFENLSEKIIKWDMVTQKHNVMLVFGNEFILQVNHPVVKVMKLLGTIRVKLGVEYKDYRKCAGCGNVEQHKRQSKSGKRISQFKVCGWCKDHNLHKALEILCHYCSEDCTDNDWPKHQLEHNVKEKGMKGNKKKSKQKPISPPSQGNSTELPKADTSQSATEDHLNPNKNAV